MQFPISFSSSSEKQQNALDGINVRGPVVKCWILLSFFLNKGLKYCQYYSGTVLLSNDKSLMVGPTSFNSMAKSSTESHSSAREASSKAFHLSRPSASCIMHHLIDMCASIAVVATVYIIDRTWCNYVCFNEDILKTTVFTIVPRYGMDVWKSPKRITNR